MIGRMITVHRRALQENCRLMVKNIGDSLIELFRLTKLDELLEVQAAE